jgi:hypothetical protein
MAERAEARLKKRDLNALAMPRTIGDKLSSIEDQVQSVLKKLPFLEKETVDEQLQALKKAQTHLATYLEKIQAAAPDLKKPATKRKDSPEECTPTTAKKVKAVMSQSDQALRLQKQMQRTLIMQSYLPNPQAALSEFEQIKQKLAEIYQDSETSVTLFTLFQMTAKEDLARVKKIQVQDFSPSEIEGTFAAFCAKQVEKEVTKTVAKFHTFILPLLDGAQKEGAQKWLEEFCDKAKTP